MSPRSPLGRLPAHPVGLASARWSGLGGATAARRGASSEFCSWVPPTAPSHSQEPSHSHLSRASLGRVRGSEFRHGFPDPLGRRPEGSMTLMDYDVLGAHFCRSGGAGWPCRIEGPARKPPMCCGWKGSSLSPFHKAICLSQKVSFPFLRVSC